MNRLSILLILCIGLVQFSCKPKTPRPEAEAAVQQDASKPQKLQKSDEATSRAFDRSVPDACSLLSTSFVSKIINVPADQIKIKDGSSPSNPKARSCFFKWEGSIPNAGILIQVMRNPVEDEFPDWVRYFVETKKRDGEQSFSEPGVSYDFVDWQLVGDEGAYSTDAGKYYWRIGNEMAFMLAFNTAMDAAEQLAAAELLAPEIMKNLK